jgi:MSHA pilin protein MshC
MRLNPGQIKAIKQESEYFSGAQEWLIASRIAENQLGFTLIELIMVMVIVGILAVVVTPRFFDANVFKSRGFADQVKATFRYAQKEAIARRGFVCVAITVNSITLTAGPTSACSTGALALPAGGNIITAPSGVTLTVSPLAPPVSFIFDALGSTAVKQTISVSGATNNVVVEAVTGYVHSP